MHQQLRLPGRILVVGALTVLALAGAATEVSQAAPNPTTPLPDQPYALCAGAQAFNFGGVTYAKCRLKQGNSLGLTNAYPGGNVLTVNQSLNLAGQFMVSTYSPPDPKEYALYQCQANGAFAQCNGGLCYAFKGSFPGLGSVADGEVICSCPIVYRTTVYHVTGPGTCPATRQEYDSICGSGPKKTQTANGTLLHVGSGGPLSVTLGLNRIFDAAFGTQSQSKQCARPAS